MAPTSTESNPNVKRAVIAFQKQGSLSKDNTTRTSYAPPQQTLHYPSMSSPYHSLMLELPKSRSSSGMGYRWCSRDKTSCRDPQAIQLPRPFSKAMP
eukprot:5872929-Ditylum_brightwellii.AAC.1